MEYAFDVLSADKVIAHCDIRNKASENVMKKLHKILRKDGRNIGRVDVLH